MQMKTLRLALLSLSLVGASSGCSRSDSDAGGTNVPSPAPSASASPIGQPGTKATKSRESLSVDPAIYEGVTSSSELFSRYAAEDRKVLLAFYDQYGPGVMRFTNREQFDWLAESGFPLPEDVLALVDLSDDTLLERYRRGDLTAGYIYLARAAGNSDERVQKVQLLDDIQSSLLASGSPFAGYAYFDYQMRGKQDPAAAYAGLAWAFDSGDQRAGLAMAEMLEAHNRRASQAIDPATLLFAYMSLQQRVRIANPGLMTRRWKPYPL
jgi:hypothetical protein